MLLSPERATAPDITVVIPTLGRPLVRGCLEAIASGRVWPSRVVVVDQGSSDAVAGWVDKLSADGLDALHIPSNERGIAAGTNRGLEAVRTPFAAVTHDDCRPRADWIDTLVRRLRDAGEVVLTGRVEPEGGTVPTFVVASEPVTYTRPLLYGDILFPANMGLPMSVLERAGCFDEDPLLQWAAEDNDWAYRVLRAGVPIVYDPTLVVGHLAWRNDAQIAATMRRYAFAQGCFYGKWLRRGDPFIALRAARDLVRAPWLLLRGAITRNPELIEMGRTELLGIGPGLVAGFCRGRTPEGPRYRGPPRR